jgi:hypothetical protein
VPLPLHSIPRTPQIFTDRVRLRPVDNRLSKICGPEATISQSRNFHRSQQISHTGGTQKPSPFMSFGLPVIGNLPGKFDSQAQLIVSLV